MKISFKALNKGLKRFFAVRLLAQTSSLCFPTGLLQKQSLQLQEQEELLKKGQQIYYHKS